MGTSDYSASIRTVKLSKLLLSFCLGKLVKLSEAIIHGLKILKIFTREVYTVGFFTFIYTMPDLLNYTGKPPNSFATHFIHTLEAEGFRVASTAQGPRGDQRKTLRITWRGIYIGLMAESFWGRKVPYACLYRFTKRDALNSVNKVPQGFDKHEFATQHSCDLNMLHLHSDYSGSYLWVQDEATSLRLMRDWARKIDEVFFGPTGEWKVEEIENDLRAILKDTSKSETERFAEVAVRLGQGKFRADLEQEFESACAVTRLAILPVLRASHIVPWRNSTSAQRLDPKNGLLLSANIDALFDRYMITFRSDGRLEVSKSVTQCELEKLGPIHDLQHAPCDRRAAYLRLHNAQFERLEQERLKYVKFSV